MHAPIERELHLDEVLPYTLSRFENTAMQYIGGRCRPTATDHPCSRTPARECRLLLTTHLRRNVVGCASQDVGTHALGCSGQVDGQVFGAAKVCQLEVTSGSQKHILWLKISVHDLHGRQNLQQSSCVQVQDQVLVLSSCLPGCQLLCPSSARGDVRGDKATYLLSS